MSWFTKICKKCWNISGLVAIYTHISCHDKKIISGFPSWNFPRNFVSKIINQYFFLLPFPSFLHFLLLWENKIKYKKASSFPPVLFTQCSFAVILLFSSILWWYKIKFLNHKFGQFIKKCLFIASSAFYIKFYEFEKRKRLFNGFWGIKFQAVQVFQIFESEVIKAGEVSYCGKLTFLL